MRLAPTSAARPAGTNGFSLVEVVISVAIMGILSVGAVGLVQTCLQAQAIERESASLHEEGFLAMERMAAGVKTCTWLLIPNAHLPDRDLLAFSGTVNDDDDYYFGDPLFPRIDEDLGRDMNGDDQSGIAGYDDDGNGWVDDGTDKEDDDEDGQKNEEVLNGEDDDGDGNIDEDLDYDMSRDDKPGFQGMDDDGNGKVDDGDGKEDDDEDGQKNEDPLNETIYEYDDGLGTLTEILPDGTSGLLSSRVTGFRVTYEGPAWYRYPRIAISLTLTGDDGESVTFAEYVYPENTVQPCGKRVR